MFVLTLLINTLFAVRIPAYGNVSHTGQLKSLKTNLLVSLFSNISKRRRRGSISFYPF